VPTDMSAKKTPKLKPSKQQRNKQVIPKEVIVEFGPLDTNIREPAEEKRGRKKKGKQVPKMPSKPNRNTRLTNQLRLNSKALFNPSLKEKNVIVIEDQDTNEELFGFTKKEEMAIHTLKEMLIGNTRKKRNKVQISGIKLVELET
jgi:hypothetical protein